MWSMIYPILIIVLSNVAYNICTKSTPGEANAFASLSVTYLIAAAVSFVSFFITAKGKSLAAAYGKLNWSSFVLGVVIREYLVTNGTVVQKDDPIPPATRKRER